MKDDLIDLAAKVEAAEGPTFELMSDAFDLCFPKPATIWADDHKTWSAEYSEWQGKQSAFCAFLDVGAWVDAAMMLVPEGCVWELSQGRDGCSALVECSDVGGQAQAATPALALTAASLRARSEIPA